LREFDYGIDLTLHDIRRRKQRRFESGFKVDIQAKSTIQGDSRNESIAYDLDVKTYDDLWDTEVGCPRILVVMLLPTDEMQWTYQSEEHLMLRHAAYWMSLKGMIEVRNQRSTRLAIPRTNLFSVEALTSIMDHVRRRQPL
jgi:hypothetical protein